MTSAVCRNGHRQTEDVIYISPDGRRGCKECNRWAAYRYRLRSEKCPLKPPKPFIVHRSAPHGLSVAERFWAKVDKRDPDECWPWKTNTKRYGNMQVDGATMTATHISLELAGRSSPSARHHACHTCDNPICVNPDHLWWGTHAENMQDSLRKGRNPHIKEKRRAAA